MTLLPGESNMARSTVKATIRNLALLVMGSSLIGCGGGGSGGSSNVSNASGGAATMAEAAGTGSATLAWTAPSARTDGEPIAMAEIAAYTIYYGETAGEYSESVTIDDAYSNSATISDLPVGTYYFVMTVSDVAGRESPYSNVATRVVQ